VTSKVSEGAACHRLSSWILLTNKHSECTIQAVRGFRQTHPQRLMLGTRCDCQILSKAQSARYASVFHFPGPKQPQHTLITLHLSFDALYSLYWGSLGVQDILDKTWTATICQGSGRARSKWTGPEISVQCIEKPRDASKFSGVLILWFLDTDTDTDKSLVAGGFIQSIEAHDLLSMHLPGCFVFGLLPILLIAWSSALTRFWWILSSTSLWLGDI
jgi:hypothetical protein